MPDAWTGDPDPYMGRRGHGEELLLGIHDVGHTLVVGDMQVSR